MDQLIQMLPESVRKYSTHMDFVGQKRAERIYQVVLTISGIIGFLLGFVTQRLSYTVYAVGIGFVISCLIVLPPWSYFRQDPVKWHVEEVVEEVKNAQKQNKKKSK